MYARATHLQRAHAHLLRISHGAATSWQDTDQLCAWPEVFGADIALGTPGGDADVLIRFNESIRVRLWGRELHSFRKGEVHHVPMVIAAVLFAQRCAEPVEQPPAVPRAQAA